MAVRTDLPYLQGARPSIFNVGASALGIVGMVAGAVGAATLFGTVAPIALFGTPFIAPLVGAAAGAAVGGLFGGVAYRGKMQNDLISGRAVSDPSFLNKGLINGLFLGGLAALGYAAYSLAAPTAALASATAAAVAGAGSAPAAFGAATTALGSAVGALALPVAIGVAALGVTGSLLRRSSQSRELAFVTREANIAKAATAAERARSQGVGQYMNSVSPEQTAALEASQRSGQGRKTDFREQLLASRAMAQGELAK